MYTHKHCFFLSRTTAGDQDDRDDDDKSDVGDGGEEALHGQGLDTEGGDSVGLGKYPHTCTCQ